VGHGKGVKCRGLIYVSRYAYGILSSCSGMDPCLTPQDQRGAPGWHTSCRVFRFRMICPVCRSISFTMSVATGPYTVAGANYRRTASSNRGRARCYSIAPVYKSTATNSGPKGLPQSASWIAVGVTASRQSKPCSNPDSICEYFWRVFVELPA
jgi:hypothetical protein